MDRVNSGGLDSTNDCLNIPNNGDADNYNPVCDLVDKLEKNSEEHFYTCFQ